MFRNSKWNENEHEFIFDGIDINRQYQVAVAVRGATVHSVQLLNS